MEKFRFWKGLKRYFFLKKLLREKKGSVSVLKCDIAYFNVCKNANEFALQLGILRKDLKQEQEKKENADTTKVSKIAYEIAEIEALQTQYKHFKSTYSELQDYIRLIQTWINELY